MLEVPAAIDKSQIAEFAKIRGKANSRDVAISGESFGAGHLKFCGFSGSRGDDLRYHGVFRFEPCVVGSCSLVPFDFLKPPAKPTPQAPKPQTLKQPKTKGGDE